MLKRKKIKKNTLELKYESLKEEYGKLAGEMILMQRKVIHLQDINIKQKEELLEYRRKKIEKMKKEMK